MTTGSVPTSKLTNQFIQFSGVLNSYLKFYNYFIAFRQRQCYYRLYKLYPCHLSAPAPELNKGFTPFRKSAILVLLNQYQKGGERMVTDMPTDMPYKDSLRKDKFLND